MTRGKHKAKTTGRRHEAAVQRIAALQQQIAEETAALTEAQAILDQVEAARVKLHHDTHALHAATGTHAARASEEHDWLASVVREARRLAADLQPGWEAYSSRCQDKAPGASPKERLESIMQVLIGGAVLSDNPASGRLDLQRITRLERARGERREAMDGAVYPPRWWWALVAGLLRPVLVEQARAAGLLSKDWTYQPPQDPQAQDILDGLAREAKAVLTSRSDQLTSTSVLYAWAPSPALLHTVAGPAPALADLGAEVGSSDPDGASPKPSQRPDSQNRAADTIGSAAPWPLPTPTMPAVQRERLGAQNSADLPVHWGHRLPGHDTAGRDLGVHGTLLGTAPRYPRPGRAAVLRSLYTASAVSSWLHAQQSELLAPDGQPQSDDRPRAAEQTREPTWGGAGQAGALGRAAVGLAAAAPFWLPAGQTHAFASSEALDDEARAEIALPYPQVLLAFAEPLVRDPVRTPTATEADAYARWSTRLTTNLNSPDGDLNALSGRSDRDLDLEAVLEFAGCSIEAVLLLADSLGAPAAEFAWCVSLPARHGRATLGRFVIPGRHDRTRHHALLGNLLAVTAWADWHEPDTEAAAALDVPGVPPPQARRDADRHGTDVHVLNVARTVGHGPATTEPTGKTVAPHVRRGHWRRQRYGERNTQVRRIRIAPLLVNAHLGDMAERVYRLPADAGQPTAGVSLSQPSSTGV